VNRLAALGRERLVAGALVIGAVVFTAIEAVRLLGSGGIEVLTLLLALLAADLVIAGALVTRWYAVRPVAQGLAIFGALVHVLVLLRSGPWLIRGWSALLAAAHICALVLFFALSAHEQYDDEDEEDVVDEDVVDAAGPSASRGAAPGTTDTEVGHEPLSGPYAALPAPRSNADLVHQVADHPAADPAPEPPPAPITDQPATDVPPAESSTPEAHTVPDTGSDPARDAEVTEPAGEQSAEESAGEQSAEESDAEQPGAEQTDKPIIEPEPDQPAEPDHTEPADHNEAGHHGSDRNGTDRNGSDRNGTDRNGTDRNGAERVESGAGRRGTPEGKE
jgi:hypothetical protein